MSEGLLFKDITIDKNLTPEEQEIINALESIDISDLKKSLQEEKISWIDQTFFDAATAFTTYNVQYKEWEKSTDDWGNEIVTESWLVCDETAPQRLKDMFTDKDQNDFAYFIYKTSEFLSVGTENIEQYTLNKNTQTQLVNLQTEIEKQKLNEEVVVNEEENNESDSNENQEEEEENTEEQIETITADEIAINNLKNGVSKSDIVSAVEELATTNPTLANEIIPLLKTGSVKEIQIKLGMEEGNSVPLYKKADGLFGKRTLENLAVGKVVEITWWGTWWSSRWPVERTKNTILIAQNTIDQAVNNIENSEWKWKIKAFVTAEKITDLQQYIYDKTWWTHPKYSGGPGNRDGIFGNNTLEGIKSLNIESQDNEVEEEIKEPTELQKKINERKELYTTKPADAKKWLIADLLLSGNYGDDNDFLGLFAKALLEGKTSFTYTNDTYTILIQEWYDPKIFAPEEKGEYNKESQKIEAAKKEKERQKKANEYANKIFPDTLKIRNIWGKKFMIKNEISFAGQNNLPQAIAELEFTEKEDAEVFIDMSKKFIKKYWYGRRSIKWSWMYEIYKKEYLSQAKDLVLYSEENKGINYEQIKMLAKLSNAIDNLECWKAIPWYWRQSNNTQSNNTESNNTQSNQSQAVSWWEYSPYIWYTGSAGPLQIQ